MDQAEQLRNVIKQKIKIILAMPARSRLPVARGALANPIWR